MNVNFLFLIRRVLRWGILGALLLLAALLGGCNWPSDEPCSESELVLVEDLAPQAVVVDTLTPTLTWSYPDASCRPEMYEISIYDEDVIPEMHGDTFYLWAPIHVGHSTEPRYTVPASAGLRPANTYGWHVEALTADYRGSAGSIGTWFTTGPLCGDLAPLTAPVPTYPPDGTQVYFPTYILFKWNNPMSCWPERNFYIQISRAEDFTEMVWTGFTHAAEFDRIRNDPETFEDCTRYYWRVRAEHGAGYSPFSETWSFVPRRTEAICPLELGITPIPPELHIPWVTVLEDAACWSGPSMEYVILDYLLPGQELGIEGRNQQGTWWYVDDPALHKSCWVYGERVEANGDTSNVPVIQASAPPVAVPSDTSVPPANCAQFNGQTCEADNHPCKWTGNVCINK